MLTRSLQRRHVLAGLAAGIVLTPSFARAQASLDASEFGVVADAGDQSGALQQALDAAAAEGRSLRLPPGTISARGIAFPAHLLVEGTAGRTTLSSDTGSIGRVSSAISVTFRGVGFQGADGTGGEPLLCVENSDDVHFERCAFRNASSVALSIFDAAATVRDCSFTDQGDAAIHALDSRGLLITGNRISGAGNAGVRIWRSDPGPDGSILTNNHIEKIDWRGGGNGQNGNGINIYKADEVIAAGNHIADCAFTAVRLNTTANTQVAGNTCLRSGEVAIFSEFGFSGSVIANNIVDGAATGISITNLDTGGHLAVCSGNIVRNITPSSAVNPDTIPIGIFAEAETAITGNSVYNVPGVAIAAGYGTFLRNVMISGNVVAASRFGIGVSVVEGAGSVRIGDNMVDAGEAQIIGLAWSEVVETDLPGNAASYPNVKF